MTLGLLLFATAAGATACANAHRLPSTTTRDVEKTIRLSYAYGDNPTGTELVTKVTRRLEAFGVSGAAVDAPSPGRLVVTLPGSAAPDFQEIKALLADPHQLCVAPLENNSAYTWRLADHVRSDDRARGTIDVRPDTWREAPGSPEEQDLFLQAPKEALAAYVAGLPAMLPIDPGHALWLGSLGNGTPSWRSYYVDVRRAVCLDSVESAVITREGKWTNVAFMLSVADGQRMSELTTRQIGRKIVIAIDHVVGSAPVVVGSFGRKGRITFTDDSNIRRFAASLRSGPLPQLTLISEER
jgi:preprotein translocase subunit SecD